MAHVVVLLSGGLDSSTTLLLALRAGHRVTPVAFDYGQRHVKELATAKRLVSHLQGRGWHVNEIVTIRLSIPFLRSALTDTEIAVPKDRDESTMADGVPITYVPGRNSIFLSAAVGVAESLDADEVWTGFNAVDYSGYPDCRPEFVEAMGKALALGTQRGIEGRPIRIHAPIIHETKAAIVKAADAMDMPFEHTWSCYVGGDKPCGHCDSCLIRATAFEKAGVLDAVWTCA